MSQEGPPVYDDVDLDNTWDDLSEEDQEAILERYDEVEEWGEFNTEEKFAILDDEGHLPEDAELAEEDDEEDDEDQESRDEPPEVDIDVDELFVDSEVEFMEVGDAPSVVVSGITIPGSTDITMSGEGYESQYLREIGGEGEDGGNEYFDGADGNTGESEGEEGGDGTSGQEEGEGEEPPLHIEIEGHCGQDVAEQLVALRDVDELFDVEVFGETYEEMELHDFTRELSGNNPYDYAIRIEVVEWREVETETDSGSGGSGNEYFGGADEDTGESEGEDDGVDQGVTEGDVPEGAEAVESGESVEDPQIYDLEEGEQNDYYIPSGETAENIIFNTTAEGAGATLWAEDDEDWDTENVAWLAEDNRSGIVGLGSANIRNIFLGHGGDSGIVIENATTVDISQVNIQNSNNGIHIFENEIDELAEDM